MRGWVSDQRGVRRCKGLHDASYTTCDKFYERGKNQKKSPFCHQFLVAHR